MSERGSILARWARARLCEALGGEPAARPDAPWCHEPGATFVTLRWRDGRLQGCIGSLEARRGVVDDVARNAVAAGLHDLRGAAITLADIARLDVEVSLLSPLEPIAFTGEAAALAALRVGVDGVVLAHGRRRATFLPVMWPRLGDPATFLGALKAKAGLPRDHWSDELALFRYTAERHVDEGVS